MTDKRKFNRILESAEITYRSLSKVKTKGTLSKDISKGGLKFIVREFIPKDSMLKIKINLKRYLYPLKQPERSNGVEGYPIVNVLISALNL